MKEFLKVGGTILGAVLGVALLGWGIYAVKVAMSPVKGAGDTVIQNNSVRNRTQAQERMQEMYAAVERNVRNVQVATAAAKQHPNDRILGTNADGALQICFAAVADYNAETGKILTRDWVSDKLPLTIDDSICEAAAK